MPDIGDNNQIGEIHHRDAAGGNISTNDPEPWLTFFRGYLHDLDQQRTRRDDELMLALREARKDMDRLSTEFDIYQEGIGQRLRANEAQAVANAARLDALVTQQRHDRIIIAVVALVVVGLLIIVL